MVTVTPQPIEGHRRHCTGRSEDTLPLLWRAFTFWIGLLGVGGSLNWIGWEVSVMRRDWNFIREAVAAGGPDKLFASSGFHEIVFSRLSLAVLCLILSILRAILRRLAQAS